MALVGGRRQPWRRWWAAEGNEPRVFGGILADPTDRFGRWISPGLTELNEHDDVRCLVLLGEPGSGKSYELARDAERRVDQSVVVHQIDLGDHTSDTELRSAILTDPIVERWKAGTDELLLFLDGFDEAHETTQRTAETLRTCLTELPADRMSMRIASRSTIWPARLTRMLDDVWPGSRLSLTIAPLTLDDIKVAAANRDGDSEAFVRRIVERDLGPLAARPITLGMLLGLGDHELTDDRVKLYRRGTARLASETNRRRREDRRTGPPVTRRVEAARLLAAMSILAGAPKMVRTADPLEDITAALALESVVLDPVDQADLDAVWDSALLIPAGVHEHRWAHRSIAEFLAAERLATLPLATAQHLLADATSGLVVPQLSGTATWTAYISDEIWAWLADTQPELLVSPDLHNASDDKRRLVARSLIDDISSGPPVSWGRSYRDLAYTGIEDDLRPLLDSTQPHWVRREILSFIRDSDLHGLADEVLTLTEQLAATAEATRHSDEVDQATVAALSLPATIGPTQIARVRQIVQDQDIHLAIRAALADRLLEHDGLASTLAAFGPLDASDYKPYAEIADIIQRALANDPTSWRPALEWIDQQPPEQHYDSTFTRTVAETVLSAMKDAGDDDSIWSLIGRIAARSIDAHHLVFDWNRETVDALDRRQRRRLALEALRAAPDDPLATHCLWVVGAIHDDDFDYWLRLYGNALASRDEPTAEAALQAVQTWRGPDDHLVAIAHAAVRDIPSLDAWYADFTSEATRRRWLNHQEYEQEQQAREAARERDRYFNADRVRLAIQSASWPEITKELTKDLDRTHRFAGGAPLSKAPGWAPLPEQDQQRILDEAVRFLADPLRQSSHSGQHAGHAYLLLTSVAPKRLDELDDACLLEWLPAIIDAPMAYKAAQALIERLAASQPAAIDDLVTRAIRKEASDQSAPTTWRIGTYTSANVVDALAWAIECGGIDETVIENYLGLLFDRDANLATSMVLRFLDDRPPFRPSPDDQVATLAWHRAVAGLVALIGSDSLGRHFDDVIAICSESPNLAAVAILRSQSRLDRRPWRGLTEDQLATLYLWARRHLPPEPHRTPGVGFSRNSVTEFASTIYGMLRERITPEAITAFMRIVRESGEPWGGEAARGVAAKLRDERWHPPSVEELKQILQDPHRRVVKSEAQLAQVLLDAIDAVHAEARQDPDARARYWHQQLGRPTTYIPLYELQFTTLLRSELEQHLVPVVVLRQETQLNLKLGEVKGSFVDIEAIIKTDDGTEIVVIIEVKGNWHDDVRTAMDTQLVQQYLSPTRTSTGIYLVAAYASHQWEPRDNRLNDARRNPWAELTELLNHQAADLSTGSVNVQSRVMDLTL